MVRCDKKDVAVFLASFIHAPDRLVGGSNPLDSGFVHTSVTNHIWWSKVVHQELVLLLSNPFRQFLSHWASAHLGVEVISGNLG